MKKTILMLIALVGAFALANAEVVFIANSSVADASVPETFVEGVLKGKTRSWPSGGNVKLAVLEGGAAHVGVLSKYTGMNPSQFSSHWNRLVFTGRAAAPKKFSSEADLVDYVNRTEGALGYVSSSTDTGSAKVLSLN